MNCLGGRVGAGAAKTSLVNLRAVLRKVWRRMVNGNEEKWKIKEMV